jgi:hypothetical protein
VQGVHTAGGGFYSNRTYVHAHNQTSPAGVKELKELKKAQIINIPLSYILSP